MKLPADPVMGASVPIQAAPAAAVNMTVFADGGTAQDPNFLATAMMASSYTADLGSHGLHMDTDGNRHAAAVPPPAMANPQIRASGAVSATGGAHTTPTPTPAPATGTNNAASTPAPTSKSGGKPAQRKRARATSEQVTVLESVFLVNRSPASRLREDLAARLGMAPRQVQVWFQNRRAKEKTQQRNPRGLQQHPAMLLDQLAYANMNPEMYSMAMASAFMPGADPMSAAAAAAAAANGGYVASPAAVSLGAGIPIINQQQQPMMDAQMALAATAAANNPWMQWSLDMTRPNQLILPLEQQQQQQFLSIPSGQQGVLPAAAAPTTPGAVALNNNPIAATHYQVGANGTTQAAMRNISTQPGIGNMAPAGGPTSQPHDGQLAATSGSAVSTAAHTPMPAASGSSAKMESSGADSMPGSVTASLGAANISDSRRESEVSVVTAVASPMGPTIQTSDVAMAGYSASASASASTSASPTTTTAAATNNASTSEAEGAASSTMNAVPAAITECPPSSSAMPPLQSATESPAMPGSSSPPTANNCTASPSSAGSATATPASSEAAPAILNAAPATSTPAMRTAGPARRPAPLTLIPQHNDGNSASTNTHLGTLAMQGAVASMGGSGGNGGGRMLTPTGIPMGVSLSGLNMSLGMVGMPVGGRMGMGYSSFIPEIASYMVLDATLLTVGTWQRVSMPDTELTCLACVEPPPLKPVQRPGNHRPAELDSLVGEFQWIISNCGVRYKMVLPYSAVSRIKFRETPDPAAALIDTMTESVVNPQTAISLFNRALKNPQAKGELSIHVYDPPKYFFQMESGMWKEIEDFSENRSASNTSVHVISGSFVTLFCQLRILLATCSRLKIAADPLMTLWLGSMDDPYSAIAGVPHNTWIPCSEAVCLHSVRPNNSQQQAASTEHANGEAADGSLLSPAAAAHHGPAGRSAAAGAVPPAFSMYAPVSAASSTIGTLTPTPTSVSCPHPLLPLNTMAPTPGSARHSVFALPDSLHQYPTNMVAAMANGAGPMSSVAPPFKTQRSASLPFIRPIVTGGGGAKANPSSGLCRAMDDESMTPAGSPMNPASGEGSSGAPRNPATQTGLGISNTPPSSAALPLRHRTSCNHLRRPAPYQVAPAAGSPRVNSPQMSPSPYWCAQNLRRASRDSLSGYFHSSMLGPNGQPTTPLGGAMPAGVFARRESDAELALAMNNAFVNGDVFGSHRGLGDINGLSNGGVPPSPLSNVAIAGASDIQMNEESNLVQAAAAAKGGGSSANSTRDGGTDGGETAANSNASDASGQESKVKSMSSSNSLQSIGNKGAAGDAVADTASQATSIDMPLSSVSPQAIMNAPMQSGMGETLDMSNADMMAAIFNAMNSASAAAAVAAAAAAGGPANQSMPFGLSEAQSLGVESGVYDPALALDPSTFMLPQASGAKSPMNSVLSSTAASDGGAQAMDWCFDWNQSVCGPQQQQLMPSFLAPGANSEHGEGEMNVDWTGSADGDGPMGTMSISSSGAAAPNAVVGSATRH